MSFNFHECNRNQLYLLPPSLQEWLPENDLAWFIIDAVQQMDLSELIARYRDDGCGNTAFHPAMMCSLILYAYSNRTYSSRKIERACGRDIGFRVIAANQKPDHSTIARFRRDNHIFLKKLFQQTLRLCAEAGLVKVGLVSLDGTKVAGNASLCSNRKLDHISREVDEMLKSAEQADQAEDRQYGADKRGDELPDALCKRQDRIKRLQECKDRLELKAREEREKQQAKVDERRREEDETGTGKRGRKPKAPDDAVDRSRKANPTDPDSRIMKTSKGYVQGYNGQAVVNESQIIIAAEVTQEANDKHQLLPMMTQAKRNLSEAGVNDVVRTAVVDAGYFTEEQIVAVETDGTEVIAATVNDYKERQRQGVPPPAPRGRIPGNLSLGERMVRKRRTIRGTTLYKKRSYLSEGTFGQLKGNDGFRRFSLRGISLVSAEWSLVCTVHNLMKLFRSGTGLAWA